MNFRLFAPVVEAVSQNFSSLNQMASAIVSNSSSNTNNGTNHWEGAAISLGIIVGVMAIGGIIRAPQDYVHAPLTCRQMKQKILIISSR